jgi:hypothetical protein
MSSIWRATYPWQSDLAVAALRAVGLLLVVVCYQLASWSPHYLHLVRGGGVGMTPCVGDSHVAGHLQRAIRSCAHKKQSISENSIVEAVICSGKQRNTSTAAISADCRTSQIAPAAAMCRPETICACCFVIHRYYALRAWLRSAAHSFSVSVVA